MQLSAMMIGYLDAALLHINKSLSWLSDTFDNRNLNIVCNFNLIDII